MDDFIEQVESYKSFYFGRATSVAVHHLQSIFCAGKKRGIVSKYAAIRLFFRVQLQQVQQFLSCPDIKKNPAFEGWVRELEFLVNLRAAAEYDDTKLLVADADGTAEEWTLRGFEEDFDPDNIDELPTKEWLIPKKFNQGGCDFIQFSDGLLRVVQVIRANQHELKLQYVCQLMINISKYEEVKFLDIVVIVNRDRLNPKVTGDLQLQVADNFITKDKWTQACIRTLQLLNALY